jgi:chorismate mutase
VGSRDALAGLAVQRLTLAEDIAAAKFASGQPIEDPVRERRILDSVFCALNGTGRHQETGVRFFRDQIEASKIVQRGLHQHWHAHPEGLPAIHRSLAAELRPKLDSITAQMIQHLMHVREMAHLSFSDIEDLLDRRFYRTGSAATLELRRDAATIALRSFFAK